MTDTCSCPPGMWHHATNCPVAPAEELAVPPFPDDWESRSLTEGPALPYEALTPKGEPVPLGKALLLTQQEWDDLCDMIAPYKFTTLKAPHIVRQRALAERIIEANR